MNSPTGRITRTTLFGLVLGCIVCGQTSTLAGNAVLTITSGFSSQPNGPNPFAALNAACGKRVPECQKSVKILNAANVTGAKADLNGKATLPRVPPGVYYVMVAARYNGQSIYWDLKVELKPGANSVVLDQRNAGPSN